MTGNDTGAGCPKVRLASRADVNVVSAALYLGPTVSSNRLVSAWY
jgi:hypothetical protein